MVELREREAMWAEEARQRATDRFWGLDKEHELMLLAIEGMAAEDFQSSAMRRESFEAEELRKRNERERKRRSAFLKEQYAEDEKARKQYMQMFHDCTSSDDVMDYLWPTQPSLKILFGGTERQDWWPLDHPLSAHNHTTFHQSHTTNRRRDIVPHPNDDFMEAMQQSRLKPQPAGGFGLSNHRPRSKQKKRLNPISKQQPDTRETASFDPVNPHSKKTFDFTIPLDSGFGGTGFVERPEAPEPPAFFGNSFELSEEDTWKTLFEIADKGNHGTVHGSDLLHVALEVKHANLRTKSKALKVLAAEKDLQNALSGISTDDPAGFTLLEWIEFCDANSRFSQVE